jgi:hypothetical protein
MGQSQSDRPWRMLKFPNSNRSMFLSHWQISGAVEPTAAADAAVMSEGQVSIVVGVQRRRPFTSPGAQLPRVLNLYRKMKMGDFWGSCVSRVACPAVSSRQRLASAGYPKSLPSRTKAKSPMLDLLPVTVTVTSTAVGATVLLYI